MPKDLFLCLRVLRGGAFVYVRAFLSLEIRQTFLKGLNLSPTKKSVLKKTKTNQR